MLLCMVTIFTILVSLIIGLSIGFGIVAPAKQQQMTAAPTTEQESLGILEVVKNALASDGNAAITAAITDLNNPKSPYRKALDWITFHDPMQLVPKNNGFGNGVFFQRYIAAYFYFAASVGGPWRSCEPQFLSFSSYNSTAQENKDECVFKRFHESDQIFSDHQSHRWLGNTSVCDWAGLVCDKHQQIIKIDLRKYLVCECVCVQAYMC